MQPGTTGGGLGMLMMVMTVANMVTKHVMKLPENYTRSVTVNMMMTTVGTACEAELWLFSDGRSISSQSPEAHAGSLTLQASHA
jgi:hypothetical protein